jgi:hypothetical protein
MGRKTRGTALGRAMKIGFEEGIAGIEQLSPRDDHDVNPLPASQ